MRGFLDAFRTGSWLTRERLRLWALVVLIASLAGLVYLLATSDGLNDFKGRPLGTDFSNVYAAGRYVLDGEPSAPFDYVRQKAREQAIFGPDTPFYGWHYPPFFLFVAAAMATMPFLIALFVWQGATLILNLWTMRAILGAAIAPPLGRVIQNNLLWPLIALAFPAVFVNIGHGHNGFLSATLMGGGLVLLDRRPVVAGILFGLLAYKPQFGLLLPLVLAVSGRWRTFAAAAATVVLLFVATTLAFGMEVWQAFLNSTRFTRFVLEQGGPGWHKIQSVFGWVRMWGGSIPLAYVTQGLVTTALAAALIALWRSEAAFPLKAAGLCIAAMLATPYALDYDSMLLAPAIAFLFCNGLQRGFAPYEKSLLAMLWLVPLIARPVALHTLVPLAVPLMIIVFVFVLRRAVAGLSLSTRWLFAARSVE